MLERYWNGALLTDPPTALHRIKTMTWKGIAPLVRLTRKALGGRAGALLEWGAAYRPAHGPAPDQDHDLEGHRPAGTAHPQSLPKSPARPGKGSKGTQNAFAAPPNPAMVRHPHRTSAGLTFNADPLEASRVVRPRKSLNLRETRSKSMPASYQNAGSVYFR